MQRAEVSERFKEHDWKSCDVKASAGSNPVLCAKNSKKGGYFMTIKDLQEKVDNWANQFEKPYFSPLSMMACITEETGEVARVMNNIYGDKKKKLNEEEKHLVEEIGDLLFAIVCLANANNINLEEAIKQKFKKINVRDVNRWEHKKN